MTDRPDRTGSSGRVVLGVLALTGVLASLQGTILLPLVSRLPGIYGVDSVAAAWILTSTMLAGAIATPIVSRLADMFGRRRLIVVALSALLLGSLLLALTDSYPIALVGRALQGVTASVLAVAMSLLKDVLPPDRVGSGIALVSATLGIGSAVGLPLAGFLYEHLGYSSLYWLTAALAALLALAAWRLLPPNVPAGARESFDGRGAILLALGLTQLLLVLSQGNVWGWTSDASLLMTAGAVAALAMWVIWQLNTRHPLIDVRLMVRRPILLTNIASVIIALGMLANLILASLQFGAPRGVDGGLGLSPGQTGLAMAAPVSVFVLGAPLLGVLLRRFGGRPVLLAGSLTMVGAYLARIVLDGSVFQVVVGSVLIGTASTLSLAAMPMIIMAAVPRRQTASANGVNSVARMLGTSISTAALAALTAATSTVVGGVEYATLTTIHASSWALAGAAAVATVVVWFIPREQAAPGQAGHAVPVAANRASDLASERRAMYGLVEQ